MTQPRVAKKKRQERDEGQYLIEALMKGLIVFEALEGRNFEPVTIKRCAKRTKLTESFCRAALLTLKQRGFAKRTLDGWIVGPKAVRLSSRITAAHSEIRMRSEPES